MLPRLRPQRPRLESGIQLRGAVDADDAARLAVDVEGDEALSPEDEKRRRAYADWLARFDKTAA
jgi:hypothetical protein